MNSSVRKRMERFECLYKVYEELKAEPPKEAGALVYLPKEFIKTGFPNRQVRLKNRNTPGTALCFERRDGKRVFRITDASGKGLPFGSFPRLIIPLINRQAVINKSREITIADTMADLLRKIKSGRTGGKKGPITDVKRQIEYLLRCTYWLGNDDQEIKDEHFFKMPDGHIDSGKNLFSSTKENKHSTKFILDEHYYQLVVNNPIPLDFRVLVALKFSPLAMDIYGWVSFKSYKGKGLLSPKISDKSLMQQFGSNYKESHEFKRQFKHAFEYVKVLYPAADIEFLRGRIKVISTTPHVPP